MCTIAAQIESLGFVFGKKTKFKETAQKNVWKSKLPNTHIRIYPRLAEHAVESVEVIFRFPIR